MPAKNHHKEAFDQETLAKLEIFEDYAQAWIPTFVMQGCEEICIFDFFAGPGKDIIGVDGSPIRVLKKVRVHIENIFKNKVKVRLFINELDQKKFNQLKSSCSEYLEENPEVKRAVSIEYFNQNFEELFYELLPIIKSKPSLVYLDQNGIKYFSPRYIRDLGETSRTDFLYFVSSSFVGRFGDTDEFKRHLKIDLQEIKNRPAKLVHRILVSEIKKDLPSDTALKLYPFSLKKGRNVYGIVFGTSHLRAVDKFLSIAWKRNEVNGEANFDIDDDQKKDQLELFITHPTKIEAFKQLVRDKILSGEISNNLDLFTFAMEEGHISTHAAECLKNMRKENEVSYDGRSPLVTYENYKLKKKLEYRIVGK